MPYLITEFSENFPSESLHKIIEAIHQAAGTPGLLSDSILVGRAEISRTVQQLLGDDKLARCSRRSVPI
jgi:hypothetical protein